MTSVDGWENFYVIVGSSAAALTGLMFVVITLASETRIRYEGAVNAFSSPTVSHFCFVLLVAAIVSTPGHSAASLGICLGIAGVAGFAYSIRTAVRIRRQKEYTPVLEDWIWHATFPILAYGAMALSALAMWRRPGAMLYVVAASALLLLYTGIHNSWDTAMYLAVHERSETPAVQPPPNAHGG
jgi:hypothetical protein